MNENMNAIRTYLAAEGIPNADYSNAIVVDGDTAGRIWSEDNVVHFAAADQWGYPTGADQITLANPSAELLITILETFLNTLITL